MSKKKRQHYIPRFYMKFFSIDDTRFSIMRLIDHKIISNVPYANQCYETYMYGQDEIWENKLQDYETLWANLLKRIIKNPSIEFTQNDVIHLHEFINYQRMRTKDTRDNIKRMKVDLFEQIGGLIAQHEGKPIEPYLMKYASKEFSDSINLREEAGLCLKIASESFKTTIDLETVVCINRTSREFISSDNPIILFNPYMPEYPAPVHAGLCIMFPISPTLQVLCYDRRMYRGLDDKKTIDISNVDDIDKMNLMQIINAESIVFARTSEILSFYERVLNICNEYHHNIPASGVSFGFLKMRADSIKFSKNRMFMFYRDKKSFDIQQRLVLLLAAKNHISIEEQKASEALIGEFHTFFQSYMSTIYNSVQN